METKMSILFYGKRKKMITESLVPIYLRVTIEGKRFEVTTSRYIESSKWSAKAEKVKGNTDEARGINSFLDFLKQKIYNYQKEILKEEKVFCIENLRQKWFGITEQKKMLIEIFQHHNNQMKALIGNQLSKATHTKYQTTMGHTQAFLQWKYKVNDTVIKKLDFEFISDFEFWFKSVRKIKHNTTLKYISNFKKIIRKCIQMGWLEKDPFFGFKMNKKEVERIALTMEEIERIKNKQFVTERLSHVRDIFLFCCYTGLAYIDVKKLRRSQISVGIDGEQWIFINRTKTETASRIPLLPYSLNLYEILHVIMLFLKPIKLPFKRESVYYSRRRVES